MNREREFTARLVQRFPQPEGMPVPLGDDAAVLAPSAEPLALAVDPVVEGVHFATGTDWELVGQKSVNRNLSDLAAMGAEPRWLLVSLILRRDMTRAEVDALLDGIAKAAAAGGAVVVGGDTTVSTGPAVVTVTAGGAAPARPLTRRGSKPGDTIHVTGPLGAGRGNGHLTFRPHVAEGCWLAGAPAVRAAMDVSDGLLVDLQTLLDAGATGSMGATLDAAAIPLAFPEERSPDRLEGALARGEDHVLLFTMSPQGKWPDSGPIPASRQQPIGVVDADVGLRIRWPDGSITASRAAGWQHEVPGP